MRYLFLPLPLFLISTGMAEDKMGVGYLDVFSLQIDRRDSWDIANIGFNLSRYIGIDYLEKDLIYPGLGIRAKVGENPKVEMFSKISAAGIIGGSGGGFYGKNGIGIGTSLWIGLEIIGMEYSLYSDKRNMEHEISIYAAYQFGIGSDGEYYFENLISSQR